MLLEKLSIWCSNLVGGDKIRWTLLDPPYLEIRTGLTLISKMLKERVKVCLCFVAMFAALLFALLCFFPVACALFLLCIFSSVHEWKFSVWSQKIISKMLNSGKAQPSSPNLNPSFCHITSFVNAMAISLYELTWSMKAT